MKAIKLSFLLSIALMLSASFPSCTPGGSDEEQLKIGMEAPDLTLPGPGGQGYQLSSLEGNYVLIDFWASWCKPCREVNPRIVRVYDKYQDATFRDAEGFEVYSISLDTDKEAWVDAISKDNMHWEYHVNDLQGARSEPLKKYGVSSIPASFLLNPEGVIIGRDLSPQELDATLKEKLQSVEQPG